MNISIQHTEKTRLLKKMYELQELINLDTIYAPELIPIHEKDLEEVRKKFENIDPIDNQ